VLCYCTASVAYLKNIVACCKIKVLSNTRVVANGGFVLYTNSCANYLQMVVLTVQPCAH